MLIEFVKVELPDSAPVWLPYVKERMDSHTIYVASGHYRYDEASRLLRRHFVNDSMRNRMLIDVGANIGAYTLAVASLGVPAIAIEALPDNFLLLTAAVEKNGLRNVRCIHAAMTDQMSVLQIGGASAWGYVSDQPGIPVPGLTLDHLLSTMRAMNIRFSWARNDFLMSCPTST
jgi:hypothetical protein